MLIAACGGPSGDGFFNGCPKGGCKPSFATVGGASAQGGDAQGVAGVGGVSGSGGDAGAGAQGGMAALGGSAGTAGGAGAAGGAATAGGAGDTGTAGSAGVGGIGGASGFAGGAGDAGLGGGAGDAGSSGAGGSVACSPEVGAAQDLTIYTGNDGSCSLALAAPRVGGFFAFDDGTLPAPSMISSPTGGRGGNGCYVRDSGSGATNYGGGISLIFNGGVSAPCVYDVTAYTGIHMYLRGTTTNTQPGANMVRVNVVTTATSDEFGTCTSGCNDHYGVWCSLTNNFTLCDVPFWNLTRRGFGSPASFNKNEVLFVQIMAVRDTGPTSWTVNLDDVSFY